MFWFRKIVFFTDFVSVIVVCLITRAHWFEVNGNNMSEFDKLSTYFLKFLAT